MQQAFTRSCLNGYLELMSPAIDETLTSWQPRQDFPLYPMVKHLLLDLAAQVFVGVELGPEGRPPRRRLQRHRTRRPGRDSRQRARRYLGPGLRARKRLERYFFDLLPERQRGSGNDLFSVLARSQTDDGLRFADRDVVNHMIFMLMAAHDTSTIACPCSPTSWAGTRTGRTCYAKIPRPSRGHAGSGRPRGFPLLDQAFDEILRMYAPAGTLFRQAIADTGSSGSTSRGAQIALALHASMRLADWWPDRTPSTRAVSASRRTVMRCTATPLRRSVAACTSASGSTSPG